MFEVQIFSFNLRGLTKDLHELFRSYSRFITESSQFSETQKKRDQRT